MKRRVIKMVIAAVGVATFALAPTAFAGDRHRIPLPHEVLGIPAPHEVILGIHGHRSHSNHYRHDYRKDYRDDHRHGHRNGHPNGHYNRGRHYGHVNRDHGRREWRDDRHHNHGRHNGHDRRSDYRDSKGKGDDRGRGGRHKH